MFRTRYNLTSSFPRGQRGLTFRKDMLSPTKLEKVTVCFRFQLDYFTSIGSTSSRILEVMDGKREMSFRVRDPLTNINLFKMVTFVDDVVEMRDLGNRDMHLPSFK